MLIVIASYNTQIPTEIQAAADIVLKGSEVIKNRFEPIKEPVKEPVAFNVPLTARQASALLKVLNNVGGPTSGPRGLVEAPRFYLENAGVEPLEVVNNGTIRFD